MINWNNITVRQIQQIDKIRKSVGKEDTEMDVYTKIISVLTGKTEVQVDSLPLSEYLKLKKEAEFLESDIKGHPVKRIKVNGNMYRFVYKIENMPFARYIEAKTFTTNFTENVHKIAASMVIPQKWTLLGWKDKKYDASKHDDYASDMLDAPFIAIYHSCVFFYHVFKAWMTDSRGYLVKELKSKGMSQAEADRLANDLCKSLDGFIPLKK